MALLRGGDVRIDSKGRGAKSGGKDEQRAHPELHRGCVRRIDERLTDRNPDSERGDTGAGDKCERERDLGKALWRPHEKGSVPIIYSSRPMN